jgi:hypothetical protein
MLAAVVLGGRRDPDRGVSRQRQLIGGEVGARAWRDRENRGLALS